MPEQRVSDKATTERVAMYWPIELKGRVRETAGDRGLTKFVIAAVEAKLGTRDEHQVDVKELGEARSLVQSLADAIVRFGDYEDPYERLLEIGLPSWVDTTGWPAELASTVPADDSTPEPVKEPERVETPTADQVEANPDDGPDEEREYSDEDLRRPLFMTGDKADKVEDLPHDQQGDNLLERLQAKGLIKPASEVIVKDAPAEESEQPSIPESTVEVPEPEAAVGASAAELGAAAEPTCPKCGGPLVQGECWECF